MFSWKSQPTFSIEKFLSSNSDISDDQLNLYVSKASKLSLIAFENDAQKTQMH